MSFQHLSPVGILRWLLKVECLNPSFSGNAGKVSTHSFLSMKIRPAVFEISSPHSMVRRYLKGRGEDQQIRKQTNAPHHASTQNQGKVVLQ